MNNFVLVDGKVLREVNAYSTVSGDNKQTCERYKIKISKTFISLGLGLLVLLSEKFKVKSSLTNMDSR